MAHYTLEHGQRNCLSTLKKQLNGSAILGVGQPYRKDFNQLPPHVGWSVDLLNMQQNGLWESSATRREAATCELYIGHRNLAPSNVTCIICTYDISIQCITKINHGYQC